MSKKKTTKLNCGFEAESWTFKGGEQLSISLIDLYNGYGSQCSFFDLANLFKELSDKGFRPYGLSRVEGYYGSTDDLLLRCGKDSKTSENPAQ